MPLNGKDIIKIMKEAKRSGVSKLEIDIKGNLKIEYSSEKEIDLPVIDKYNEEAMVQVAEDAIEEEGFKFSEESIAELEIHNPAELDRQISLGNIKEEADGTLTPA